MNCGTVFRRFQGTWLRYGGRVVRRRGDGGRYCVWEAGPAGLSGVAGGCAGVEGTVVGTAFWRWVRDSYRPSREVAPGSRDGGRYCILEVSPGRLSGIAGSCAGVEGTVVGTAFRGRVQDGYRASQLVMLGRSGGGWYCVLRWVRELVARRSTVRVV